MSTPQHWDRHAARFTSEVFDITRAHRGRTLERLVLQLAPPKGTGTLLDAGCGIGTFTRTYGERFHHVIAMDFSPAILRRAMTTKPFMPNVTWMCDDIVRLPTLLRPGLADLTVSFNVLTYAAKERNQDILRALRVLTAKRGAAVVVAPSAESEAEASGVSAEDAATHLQQRLGLKQTFFTRDELARSARKAGWKYVDIMPITYPRAYERVGKAGANSKRDNYDWLAVLSS